ncbi:MAG: hypothetical protein ACU0AZ_15860 [Paracoccaceae bacterium]
MSEARTRYGILAPNYLRLVGFTNPRPGVYRDANLRLQLPFAAGFHESEEKIAMFWQGMGVSA